MEMTALRADEFADLTALWRMVELCLPPHEECGAATFLPHGEETFDRDWQAWSAEIYGPVLRPALLAQQCAAAGASPAGMLREDEELGAALPEPAARRSLAAGRRVLLDFTPPQGAKLLERLREAAAVSDEAGHLVTVFAVRAHIFHLPAVQVAASFLLAECVLGATSAGLTLPARRTASLLHNACSTLPRGDEVQLLAV
jgi:hypothetical protein